MLRKEPAHSSIPWLQITSVTFLGYTAVNVNKPMSFSSWLKLLEQSSQQKFKRNFYTRFPLTFQDFEFLEKAMRKTIRFPYSTSNVFFSEAKVSDLLTENKNLSPVLSSGLTRCLPHSRARSLSHHPHTQTHARTRTDRWKSFVTSAHSNAAAGVARPAAGWGV